jgi:hypothetical protein
VHLYNLDADRPVQNAPIKGQCSRDYFYGKDLKVENHLGNLEGHYARILSSLVNGTNLTRADENWLRLFTIIQSRRTERAVTQVGEIQEGFVDEVFKNQPDQQPARLTHQQLVALSMEGGLAMNEYAHDLKFIVLRMHAATDNVATAVIVVVSLPKTYKHFRSGIIRRSDSVRSKLTVSQRPTDGDSLIDRQ